MTSAPLFRSFELVVLASHKEYNVLYQDSDSSLDITVLVFEKLEAEKELEHEYMMYKMIKKKIRLDCGGEISTYEIIFCTHLSGISRLFADDQFCGAVIIVVK